jgi:hypothetical protein
LPLPPGLADGTYQLAVRLGASDTELKKSASVIGNVILVEPAPAQPLPAYPLAINFGDAIRLAGYDATLQGQTITSTAEHLVVAEGGDYLQYKLFWRATGLIEKNYHGFIHLTDQTGRAIAQEDHVPGPMFHPPALWDQYYLQPDTYLLRIPQDAPSGLYWPAVRIYDSDTQELLSVADKDGKELGDNFRLPPVKIVRSLTGTPAHKVAAQIGATATLLGYDLTPPVEQFHAGDAFTLTLYYRSETGTTADYTRFVHLHNPTLGMAAQFDSPPQNGVNPTWSWQPGEVIADSVGLTIAKDAKPGSYTLYVGFYEPKANNARVPLRDGNGNAVLDERMTLTEIMVRP